MLDTIVIVILILSALVYGFWQYFARPSDAKARDKKSKQQRLTIFGKPRGFPCGDSDVFSAQKTWFIWKDCSLQPTQTESHSFFGNEKRLKRDCKKANRDFLRSFANRDSSRLFYNFRWDTSNFLGNDASFVGFSLMILIEICGIIMRSSFVESLIQFAWEFWREIVKFL